MIPEPDSAGPPVFALEVFEPRPGERYSLEAAAALARVPRRVILLYFRAGLVHAEFEPPYGAMRFTEDAIFAVRRIEYVRRLHELDIRRLTAVIALLGELAPRRSAVHRGSSAGTASATRARSGPDPA